MEEANSVPTETPSTNLLNVLKNFGWASGFNSPFANDENRKLEQQLERSQRELNSVRLELDDNVSHILELRRLEFRLNDDFRLAEINFKARKECLVNEKDILSQRTTAFYHTQKDREDMKKALKELRKRNISQINIINRRKVKLYECFASIQENVKILKMYEERKLKHEAAYDTLIKLDISEEKQFESIRKNVYIEESRNKKLKVRIEKELSTTEEMSEQYKRLCSEFQFLHFKRKEILNIWSKALKMLMEKDTELQTMSVEYYETKEQLRSIISSIECTSTFNDQKLEEIAEIEYKLQHYENQTLKINENVTSNRKYIGQLEDSIKTANSEVERIIQLLSREKSKINSIKSALQTIKEKEKCAEYEVENLRLGKNNVGKKLGNSRLMIETLEKIVTDEEEIYESLNKAMEKLDRYVYEKRNSKIALEKEYEEIRSQFDIVQKRVDQIKSFDYDNTRAIARCHGKIYRIDLDINKLENKVSNLIASGLNPQIFESQKKIQEEKKIIRQLFLIQTHIDKENRRLSSHVLKFQTEINVHLEAERKLKNELYERELALTETERELSVLNEDDRRAKIDYNLVKLTKTRLILAVQEYHGKIFTISQLQSTFKTAAMERKAEINMLIKVLTKRQIQLRKGKMSFENKFNKLRTIVKSLKAKYMIVAGETAVDDVTPQQNGFQQKKKCSDDDESCSLLASMKKLIIERTMLKQKEFELRDMIKADSSDLEGLENVLKIMSTSNNAFAHSLCPAPPNSKEINNIKEIVKKERETMVFRNKCKKIYEKMKEALLDLKREKLMLRGRLLKDEEIAEVRLNQITLEESELMQIKSRVLRWNHLISQLNLKLHESRNYEFNTEEFEKKLHARMLREKIKQAKTQMTNLSQANSHISNIFKKHHLL